MKRFSQAGMAMALGADTLNDIEKKIIANGIGLTQAEVYDVVCTLAAVRDMLAHQARQQGIPDEMIFKITSVAKR